MEVNSEWVDIVDVWKNVNPSIVSEHELLICFVDESSEQQNVGVSAPVLNFAPKPSSMHMFGGAAIDTAQLRKVQKVGTLSSIEYSE